MTLPTDLTAEQKALLDKLSKLSGSAAAHEVLTLTALLKKGTINEQKSERGK